MYLINTSPEWEQETARLVERLRSVLPGEAVTYVQLSVGTNYKVSSKHYPLICALRQLEQEGVLFLNIRAVGYRRATDQMTHTIAVPKGIRKTSRASKRALRKARTIDETKLTPQQFPTHLMHLAVLTVVKRATHGNAIRMRAARVSESLVEQERKRLASLIKG
jgi:hypothetical protein